jgi:hypothetical protein
VCTVLVIPARAHSAIRAGGHAIHIEMYENATATTHAGISNPVSGTTARFA